MKYIFDDIFTELDHIDNKLIPELDNLRIKPELVESSKSASTYYKNIDKIYSDFKDWNNPIKYITNIINVYNQPFFCMESSRLLTLNNNNIFNLELNEVYELINVIQFLTIFTKYDFLLNHKKILHINFIDYDTKLFYIFDYLNCQKPSYKFDIKKDKFVFNEKSISKLKKYDFIYFFLNDRRPTNENQELYNINNQLINLFIILNNLEEGGSALIYFPSIYEKASQSMIMLLQIFFEKIYLFHPHFYSYSWANWVICKNFKKINTKFEENLNKDLKDIISKKDYKPFNKLFSNQIFTNYTVFNSNLYQFNNKQFNMLSYFMDNKLKFDKEEYLQELLAFYINYSYALQINNFYVIKALFHHLKYIKNTKNLLLVNINDYEIYEFLAKNIKNISVINDNPKIISKVNELAAEENINLNIIGNLSNSNYEYDLIMIKNENNLFNILEIFQHLEEGKFMIFFKENILNLKCFLDNVKYKLIENNSNVIIKKISN